VELVRLVKLVEKGGRCGKGNWLRVLRQHFFYPARHPLFNNSIVSAMATPVDRPRF